MNNQNDFIVMFEDPDFDGGARRPFLQDGETRTRSYCRRIARQLVFEGATRADVVRVSDQEVVRSYTPRNAPVARPRQDGRCPLQYGNDGDETLPMNPDGPQTKAELWRYVAAIIDEEGLHYALTAKTGPKYTNADELDPELAKLWREYCALSAKIEAHVGLEPTVQGE